MPKMAIQIAASEEASRQLKQLGYFSFETDG